MYESLGSQLLLLFIQRFFRLSKKSKESSDIFGMALLTIRVIKLYLFLLLIVRGFNFIFNIFFSVIFLCLKRCLKKYNVEENAQANKHRQPASTIANISTRNLTSKINYILRFKLIFNIKLKISNKNNLYLFKQEKADRNCATLLRPAKTVH